MVEDYRPLADLVAEGLSDQGMATDVAYDGTQAKSKLTVNAYDVVVLDRNLPGIHGDALCKMISGGDKRVMVLMLSGAESPGDRVLGLSIGADDYLTKPFHLPELVLRVRALAGHRSWAGHLCSGWPGWSWTACAAAFAAMAAFSTSLARSSQSWKRSWPLSPAT